MAAFHAARTSNARPSRRSAIKPETILPHSGRRLVGTLALHCPSRRLVGTLALHCPSRRLVGTLVLQSSCLHVKQQSCAFPCVQCIPWLNKPEQCPQKNLCALCVLCGSKPRAMPPKKPLCPLPSCEKKTSSAIPKKTLRLCASALNKPQPCPQVSLSCHLARKSVR
jgi:hypothetical protein